MGHLSQKSKHGVVFPGYVHFSAVNYTIHFHEAKQNIFGKIEFSDIMGADI